MTKNIDGNFTKFLHISRVFFVCFQVSASILNFGGGKYTPCLATYTADGSIRVFSLPSLRPLLDVFFVANTGFPLLLSRTMCFTNFGHG